jgi:hypothetical protein
MEGILLKKERNVDFKLAELNLETVDQRKRPLQLGKRACKTTGSAEPGIPAPLIMSKKSMKREERKRDGKIN